VLGVPMPSGDFGLLAAREFTAGCCESVCLQFAGDVREWRIQWATPSLPIAFGHFLHADWGCVVLCCCFCLVAVGQFDR
jgi:hypothetical protein